MEEQNQEEKKPLIELIDIHKVYGTGSIALHALRGINLKIYPGDFVAVMGPSGSGKSTCLNILGCLDVPTDGVYSFQGVEVNKLSRNQRALLRRHYLGFVFQGFNLLNRTSAVDNVALPLMYRGMRGDERELLSLKALNAVGLTGWEHHTPAELSGGQQQRVAIARAIASNPKALMADEPTGNLDTKRSQEIMELLCELNNKKGITIVMVTHEPDMAQYAKRIIHFVDGLISEEEIPNRPPQALGIEQ
jgi:putative ABC transport system ATP-binding protein